MIRKTGKKYARIDVSGCYGGDEIEDTTVPKTEILTISAEVFIDTVTKPQKRPGSDYQNISCTMA